MSYVVKEIFYSLKAKVRIQDVHPSFVGLPAAISGPGREEDRATAICRFCDTEFVGTDGSGGGRFASAPALAQTVAAMWPADASPRARPLVICTGGEPLLQLDEHLVAALHDGRFEVAIETNGTQLPPPGIDWICVSPRPGGPGVAIWRRAQADFPADRS